MQTFMPDSDYGHVSKILDVQRLGKQRIEGSQILAILLKMKWNSVASVFIPDIRGDDTIGYLNHPAVVQWTGHEGSLANYVLMMCKEWRHRGYMDIIANRVSDYLLPLCSVESYEKPDWLYDDRCELVCSSHRSVLLAKDWLHYSKFNWPEKPADREPISGRWPYVWPTRIQPGPKRSI